MAWVSGREIPDVTFGAGARPVSGQLVPVTTWVHPDLLIPAQPPRASGWQGGWARSPYALVGLVVGVAVVAALAVCLAVALVALVAWVTAHALVVGIGIAAVAGSALALLRALTQARNAGPAVGGCCRWGHHDW
jgi:hypothetical protein